MNAINIVGGSIAGFALARELAKQGWEARVIEEHETIGTPEHCTGLISQTGVKRTGIDLDEIGINEIKGAKIYSNSGHLLRIERREPVAYVVSRPGLDQVYAREAQKAGVEVRKGLRLIDAKLPTLFLRHSTGHGELVKGKYVVGADGPNSVVRNLMNYKLSNGSYFVAGVQGRAKGSFDKDFVELYFGTGFARNFFAWVVPESKNQAILGTAVPLGEDLAGSFNKFLAKFDVKQEDLTGKNGGLIPIGPPMEHFSKGDSLLIGDAGYMAKSTTGGGIINSCMAAKFAAQSITERMSGKSNNFGLYDALVKQHISPDLQLHWRIHKFLRGLSDEQFDKLVLKAQKAKVGEFLSEHGDMDQPTKFWNKIGTTASFWRFAPELLKFSMM